MKKIYHHFRDCEEYGAGMWRHVFGEEKEILFNKAVLFTGNAELYGSWMLKVIDQWPKSCEHNLTNSSMNKQAWIGHAACCLAIGCPEDVTRLAWRELTQKQQDDANKKADYAISVWEKQYMEKQNAKAGIRGQLLLDF